MNLSVTDQFIHFTGQCSLMRFSRDSLLLSTHGSDRNLCQQRVELANDQSVRFWLRFVLEDGEKTNNSLRSCRFHVDYTLARYKPTLHSLIYDHAKRFLVKNFRVKSPPRWWNREEVVLSFSIPMTWWTSAFDREWALEVYIWTSNEVGWWKSTVTTTFSWELFISECCVTIRPIVSSLSSQWNASRARSRGDRCASRNEIVRRHRRFSRHHIEYAPVRGHFLHSRNHFISRCYSSKTTKEKDKSFSTCFSAKYFVDNGIAFASEYVHYDVRVNRFELTAGRTIGLFRKRLRLFTRVERCIRSSGRTLVRMTNALLTSVNPRSFVLETYFEENVRLKSFLERLQQANKQIFLITNSAYWYVNLGMTYLLGRDWRNFFDVIICQARKPSFFGAEKRFYLPLIRLLRIDQSVFSSLDRFERLT